MMKTLPPLAPGRKIRRLASELGKDYRLRSLDMKNGLYRDLGGDKTLVVNDLDTILDDDYTCTIVIYTGDKETSKENFKGTKEELIAKLENAGKEPKKAAPKKEAPKKEAPKAEPKSEE